MSEKPSIEDFVATDEGGFLNLRSGEVLSVDEMLCRYGRAEVESVPIGHRRQRLAGRRRSPSPAQVATPAATSDSSSTPS